MRTQAWRSWASRSIAPQLARPTHWPLGVTEWTATDFGAAGAPTPWLAQGLIRWPAHGRPTFRVDTFVLPLFVPTDAPGVKWLRDLRSQSGGRAFDDPAPEDRDRVAHDVARAFNADGLPFIERIGTLGGFLDHVMHAQARLLSERGVFWHGEDAGYAAVLLEQYDAAAEQLGQHCVDQADDRDWETESRRRAARILELLRVRPEGARAQLDRWADQSATALGLSRPSATTA